tara:strand:+ start:608 stop:814 length:207 start_codon:yes stop_codon:yes gene_type:complete
MSINIHSVVTGPHTRPDMLEGTFVMLVVAIVNGEMDYSYELYSKSFDWLYGIQNWCVDNVEPYKLGEY